VAFGQEWAGFGKEVGLVAWRIENKIPVPCPEFQDNKNPGKLYSGDSYIFLKTSQKTNAYTWDIHFWLGAESSTDEIGIAAYKTVELDEYLGGGPVQYRETQANESPAFMSLFKQTGLEYMDGGVASGFVKVDRDSYETRLLHLKGKRIVRCNKVKCESASLNTGDVFILDMGLKLYLFNGKDANREEKNKGYKMIQKIKDDERGGKASITFIDEDADNADFWDALGGQIEVTNTGEDDAAAEKKAKDATKMFQITDASGSVEFNSVEKDPKGRLQRDMLKTEDVFVIDADTELFLWIGKGASQNEKKESMLRAMDYLNKAGKPNLSISRVVEGAENAIFKALFFQWEKAKVMDFAAGGSSGVAKTPEQQAIDFKSLQKKTAAAAMVDDAKGSKEIWRVEDFKKQPVPGGMYGQFYGGDSYVLLYTYLKGGSEEYIIYFWQGRTSSKDEVGASALLAKELDDTMGDRPVQCRVVQGKEPAHFRAMFGGKMIVHKGGRASGFKNSTEKDTYDDDGISLFHVKGTTPQDTCAVQVDEEAKNLNSGDCFVLLTKTHMYSWQGNASNDEEKTSAKEIAEELKDDGLDEGAADRTVVVVAEGEEPEEFWKALGGKADYPKLAAGEPEPKDPRLFQCTNMTGVFTCDEIPNFDQGDLVMDDVMILDCFNLVYLWVGEGANDIEKKMGMETAEAYVKAAAAEDGRDPDTTIMQVKACKEPAAFTSNFTGWDPDLFAANRFEGPYEKKLREQREAKEKANKEANAEADKEAAAAAAKKAAEDAEAAAAAEKASGSSFTLEQLQAGTPEGVDAANKPVYLADDVFQELFGMDKAAYEKLAGWKKTNLKKKHGLF